jgi:hypothetical protein
MMDISFYFIEIFILLIKLLGQCFTKLVIEKYSLPITKDISSSTCGKLEATEL